MRGATSTRIKAYDITSGNSCTHQGWPKERPILDRGWPMRPKFHVRPHFYTSLVLGFLFEIQIQGVHPLICSWPQSDAPMRVVGRRIRKAARIV